MMRNRSKLMAIGLVAMMLLSGFFAIMGAEGNDAEELYGMGANAYGQQGDGTTTNVTSPTQIGADLGDVSDVRCSQSTTFFITSDGKLYGMGANAYGQQGDGTTTNVLTPTQIGAELGAITDVACSSDTTFFITSDGKLYGMGRNNNAQQGNGTTTNVLTPTQIGAELGAITDVACSSDTTFFITSDGKLYGMGKNDVGQINSSGTNITSPTQIGAELGAIEDVRCSQYTTFFITSDGKLYGMGKNGSGQIGNGTTTNVTSPTQIGADLGNVKDVVCSLVNTYFITSDGKLYGMGDDGYGQMGNGSPSTKVTSPWQIGADLESVIKVECNSNVTFFITSDGKLYGMGINTYGQQGNGTTTYVSSPTQIGADLGNVTDVACSTETTFFITSDGKLYGMGRGGSGQIGNGTTDVTSPTQIGAEIGAMGDVFCAVQTTFFLSAPPVSITLDAGNGTLTGETTIEVTVGRPYGELPTPTPKGGYTFTGWYDPNGNKVTSETIVTETEDFTLTAHYELSDALKPVKALTDFIPILMLAGLIIAIIGTALYLKRDY